MSVKETKTKILDAALALISKDGLKATTTKAIAEAAGVNEVTVFRHFESKEKLFIAIIDREAEVRFDIVQIEFEPSDDMINDLTMIGNFISENMLKRAGLFRLMVMEIDRYPDIWEHIGTVPLAGISMLGQFFDKAKKRGLVRKDVDSELMAISFFSFLFRILVVNAFLGNDLFVTGKRDDGMRDFAKIFVNGVVERGD